MVTHDKCVLSILIEFFPAVKRRMTETAESPAKRRRVHLNIHQRAQTSETSQ